MTVQSGVQPRPNHNQNDQTQGNNQSGVNENLTQPSSPSANNGSQQSSSADSVSDFTPIEAPQADTSQIRRQAADRARATDALAEQQKREPQQKRVARAAATKPNPTASEQAAELEGKVDVDRTTSKNAPSEAPMRPTPPPPNPHVNAASRVQPIDMSSFFEYEKAHPGSSREQWMDAMTRVEDTFPTDAEFEANKNRVKEENTNRRESARDESGRFGHWSGAHAFKNRFDPNNEDKAINAEYSFPAGATEQDKRDFIRKRGYQHSRELRDKQYTGAERDTAIPNVAEPHPVARTFEHRGDDIDHGILDEDAQDFRDDIGSRRQLKEKRLEEVRNQTNELIDNILFHLEGASFVKDEETGMEHFEYSDQLLESMRLVIDMYGCSATTAARMVAYRMGLGLGNRGMIANESAGDFMLSEDAFSRACHEMKVSQEKYGNPFHLNNTLQYYKNTACIPMGYIDRQTLREITRNPESVLYGATPSELQAILKQQWNESTFPRMMQLTEGNHMDQRASLFNMMRAIMERDGVSEDMMLNQYGVPYSVENALLEQMAENIEMRQTGDPDFAEIADANDVALDSNEALARMYKDKRFPTLNKGAQFVTGIMRSMGILDPFLIASGYVEHLQGSFFTWGANKILERGNSEEFRPTEFGYQAVIGNEGKAVIASSQALFSIGGMDAVRGFWAEVSSGGINLYEGENPDVAKNITTAARAYIKEHIPVGSSYNKVTEAIESLIPGNALMRGVDSKRWLESFMVNMAAESNEGGAYVNAQQFDASIREQGITKTMADCIIQRSGSEALLSMNNMNIGSWSPQSAYIRYVLRNHGITDLVLCAAIDKYLTYGINLVGRYLPFSNVISYGVTKGLFNIKPDGNITRIATQTQIGWGVAGGLKKAFVYDCQKLASPVAIALFWFALSNIIGNGDDDDEDGDNFMMPVNRLKEQWTEWTPNKFIPAWWSNDMVGWGLPLGTAMYCYSKTNDPGLAMSVLCNGLGWTFEGSSVIDTMDAITEVDAQIAEMNRLATDPDYQATESNGLTPGVMLISAANFFTAGFTPAFIRNYWPNGRAWNKYSHSSSYKYDTENYDGDTAREKNKKVNITDYDEIVLRRYTASNPLLALAADLFTGSGVFDFSSDKKKTGFLFSEMPVSDMADQVSMVWRDRLELDDYDKMTTEEKDVAAANLISLLDQWESPSYAIAQGFILPYNARENLRDYCEGMILQIDQNYVKEMREGMYPDFDSSYAAGVEVRKQKAYYKAMLNNWVYNEDIPSGINRYWKLNTDTYKVTVAKDTQEPVSWFYKLTHPTNVETLYIPKGNTPTPIGSFVNDVAGFNEETELGWQKEGVTDRQKIIDMIGDTEIKYGRDAGKRLQNAISGGDDLLETDPNATMRADGMPFTLNYRSYEYHGEKLPDDFGEDAREKAAERYGIDLGKLDSDLDDIYNGNSSSGGKGGSSYKKSSGGGGGSSSYFPKIYSNPRSVNADRPATLSGSNRPYHRNTTYIRPNFETKGSREAYKRGDI